MTVYTNAVDEALINATPLVAAPIVGELTPVGMNTYRFVLGANGLFLQARTHVIDVCKQLNQVDCRLPYGKVEEYLRYPYGNVPAQLIERMKKEAIETAPNEWAAQIAFSTVRNRYEYLTVKSSKQTPVSIQYSDPTHDNSEYLLLDAHSHGHSKLSAKGFSSVDDQSDAQGIYIALVLGNCREDGDVEHRFRLCVHGYFFDLDGGKQ